MIRERENYNAFLLHFLERLNSCDSIEKKITESLTDICEYYGFKRAFIYQTDGFRYFYLKETIGNNDNILRQRFEISEMSNQHVAHANGKSKPFYACRTQNASWDDVDIIDFYRVDSLLIRQIQDSEGKIIGFIGFADREYAISFTDEELQMIHLILGSLSKEIAVREYKERDLVLEKQKGMLTEGNHFTFAIAVSATAMRGGHIEIVGAGPGDPELISVRGKRMLEKADLVLYAGSLVPRELTFYAKEGATVRSSAGMDLEEQFALMKEFYDKGLFIVRLHTGDPCIYGAIQEQMAFFDRYKMSYHITPGISSFQAAAAALRSQFTIPEKVQSIILTRGEGRTPMPEKEQLHKLAQSQSTMCIYLSAGIVEQVQEELMQAYPPETPVAACYKLTWKEEKIYRGELKDLAKIVRDNNLTLTTLLVVGEAIDNRKGLSRLYAHEFKHLFRK